MNDKEEQEDEGTVLSSIYDESTFTFSHDGDDPGGQFVASFLLPQPFYIFTGPRKTLNHDLETECTNFSTELPPELVEVKYLPPVTLNFELPPDYPSTQPPRFTISCKWLTKQKLSGLCRRLDEIWEENAGCVILFLWTNFLQNEAFDFLNLSSPLDLSNVVSQNRRTNNCSSNTPTLNHDPVTLNSDPVTTFNSDPVTTLNSHPVATFNSDPVATLNCDPVTNFNSEAVATLNYDPRAVQDIASQVLLLPAIRDFDLQERQKQFDRTVFSCKVCLNDRPGSHCIRFSRCEHVYCKDCMKDYFVIQIGDGNVAALNCPEEKCDSAAHPGQVKELVSAQLFARYDQLLLKNSLETMADVVYCPRPVCQNPVIVDNDSNMASCAACQYVFCILCKLVFHGLSPCRIKSDQLKKLRDEYLAADDEGKRFLEKRFGKQAIERAVEETWSNEWLEKNAKQCPSCGTQIQKSDGCNKMTCTKCRTYFCWLCGNTLSRANPYNHFNVANAECYNRLFEGMEAMNEDFFEDDFIDEFLD